MRTHLRVIATVAALFSAGWTAGARQSAPAATADDVLRFAVIGDNGNGSKAQFEVGQQMAISHASFPFELVLMLGDNMYGRQQPADFVAKFERPYAALLQAGVPFYAALGNHDNSANRFYRPFNMGGERYYTFVRRNVRFVVLDTNLMDPAQLAWAEKTLQDAPEAWKVCYFHHPLYSNGDRHGSNIELRVLLEPLLVRHGVDVVFTGHDHTYERIKPQKGITHFVEGASGQLRKGGMTAGTDTAAFFDEDHSFMLAEIKGAEMTFKTVARTGRVVDSGIIRERAAEPRKGTL